LAKVRLPVGPDIQDMSDFTLNGSNRRHWRRF
jgi:hypothetical protein